MVDLQELLQEAKHKLASVYPETAALESRILLSHFLKISQNDLIIHKDLQITKDLAQQFFKDVLGLRLNHMPIAYILGYKEFYARDFVVNPAVLIPRPDSETIVDAILANSLINTNSQISFLELGFGSGCLIITIIKELIEKRLNNKILHVFGIEKSYEAYQTALKNFNSHDFDTVNYLEMINSRLNQRNPSHYYYPKINLINLDWKDFLCKTSDFIPNIKFDVIFSNPPYILPKSELSLLAIETQQYEPHEALFVEKEEDPLRTYELFANSLPSLLAPEGSLYLEINPYLYTEIINLFQKLGWSCLQVFYDLSNKPRCLELKIAVDQ